MVTKTDAVEEIDDTTPCAIDVATLTSFSLILETLRLLLTYSTTTCTYALSEYVSKYPFTTSIYLGNAVIKFCVCSTIIGTTPTITISIVIIPTNIASKLAINLDILFSNKFTNGFNM